MSECETIRSIAMALPEVQEQDHQGRPSFRINNRIFATLWPTERRAVVKLALPDQSALVLLHPDSFSPVPGTWGNQGWTNVELAAVSRDVLEQTVRSAWTHVAPKRLIARITGEEADSSPE
jgi:hypothetical protein